MRITFDLDGTLIDSAGQIHAIANRVLAGEGASPLPSTLVKSFVGNGLPVLLDRSCDAAGLERSAERIERMRLAFEELYATDFSGATLYPGVIEALETLTDQGHALALCTNKPNGPTLATLAHFGLDRLLPVVIGGDSLPVRKPDPAPLQAAFDALGNGPCLYVGDSEVDAACAEAAKVDFIFFTEGYLRVPLKDLKIRARFSDFAALPALVAGLEESR
ncbi:phosphoglycolate phosphatase [Frigidibacter sp. MR17.14]|uniref:phosphoglycolate phosphatase n=1 Tax=Frigidibacter sp. MR17.14 TaxID=3126509 RepID=UPI00301316EC